MTSKMSNNGEVIYYTLNKKKHLFNPKNKILVKNYLIALVIHHNSVALFSAYCKRTREKNGYYLPEYREITY